MRASKSERRGLLWTDEASLWSPPGPDDAKAVVAPPSVAAPTTDAERRKKRRREEVISARSASESLCFPLDDVDIGTLSDSVRRN